MKLASNQRFPGESDRVVEYIGAVADVPGKFAEAFKTVVEAAEKIPDIKVNLAQAYQTIKNLGIYHMYIYNLAKSPVSLYMYNYGCTRKAVKMCFKNRLHGKKVTIGPGEGDVFSYSAVVGQFYKEVKLYKDNRGFCYSILRGGVYIFSETGNPEYPYAMRDIAPLTKEYGRGKKTNLNTLLKTTKV